MTIEKEILSKKNKTLTMFTLFISLVLTSQVIFSTTPLEGTSASIIDYFPSPKSQSIVYEDNFERASLGTDWTHVGSGSYGINTDTSQSPTRSAYHCAAAGELRTKVIDISSYGTGNVSYWVRQGDTSIGSENPDAGENLVIEYINNIGGWSILDTLLGSDPGATIYSRFHALPANAFHSGFRLRFRTTGGSGSDYDWWHFDDVKIEASGSASGSSQNPFLNLYYNFMGINEIYVGSSDYIEFINYGLSRDMTGWYVKVWENSYLDYTYYFPNGWTHQQDTYMSLKATSGSDSSTTLYIGTGVSWDYYDDIAVGLFDNTGANIDWFETEGHYGGPTDAEWDTSSGQEINFYSGSYYAYRDHQCDLDSPGDWTTSSYGSQWTINPGQAVEDWYLYKILPRSPDYYDEYDDTTDTNTDESIEFKWTSLNADFGAVEYTLQISDSSDFSTILHEENNITEGLKFTSIIIDNTFSAGDYYWRVRPVYQGFTGTWSVTYIFESTKANPMLIIIIIIILIGVIGSIAGVAIVVKKKQATTARNSELKSRSKLKTSYTPAKKPSFQRTPEQSRVPTSGSAGLGQGAQIKSFLSSLPPPVPSYTLAGKRASSIALLGLKYATEGQIEKSINSMILALKMGVPEPLYSQIKHALLDTFPPERTATAASPSLSIQTDVKKTATPAEVIVSDSVVCKKCGSEYTSQFKYCKNCGNLLVSKETKVEHKVVDKPLPIGVFTPTPKVIPPVAPQKLEKKGVICNKCGYKIDSDGRFCLRCGNYVDDLSFTSEVLGKKKESPEPIIKFPMPKVESVEKRKRGDVLLRQAKILQEKYNTPESEAIHEKSKIPKFISKSPQDVWTPKSTSIHTKFEPEADLHQQIKLSPLNKNSLFPSITSSKSTDIHTKFEPEVDLHQQIKLPPLNKNSLFPSITSPKLTSIELRPSAFQSKPKQIKLPPLNKNSLFPSITSPNLTTLKLKPSVFQSKSIVVDSNLLDKKSSFPSITSPNLTTLKLKPSVFQSKSKVVDSNLLNKKYKSISEAPKTDDGISITELKICIKCGTHNRISDRNCNTCQQVFA